MLENERQLATAREWVTRMIRQREEALREPHWNAELRQDVADGIDAQRCKIEWEIAEYLAEIQTPKLEPISPGVSS